MRPAASATRSRRPSAIPPSACTGSPCARFPGAENPRSCSTGSASRRSTSSKPCRRCWLSRVACPPDPPSLRPAILFRSLLELLPACRPLLHLRLHLRLDLLQPRLLFGREDLEDFRANAGTCDRHVRFHGCNLGA